ncbi:hypothetical protein [Absidia glauca]|uniref:Uncharacterized protein n=1 Tax=Absidia glauca TaxID=4829 RepID=A0A163K678_ABSGL|nr:hypothetical protein [Absidia glauca]
MKTHQENGNGYQQEMNGNVISMDDKKQANHHSTNGSVTDGSHFITRVVSLPLVQEGLSTTQCIASRFKLGRFLLHQSHSIVERLTHAMHKTQETPSYQHYFQQNGYLQQALHRVDDWACFSLDVVETKIPLIQQPTSTIVDTLIVQPRQQVKLRYHFARDTLITQPLSKVNDKLNKDLDRLELWLKNKGLVAPAADDKSTTIHHRLLFLGGSLVHTVIGSGKEQATVAKQQGLEWTHYQINHQPLLSQKIVPLMKSIKSYMDASLSQLNQWMHMASKTEPTL